MRIDAAGTGAIGYTYSVQTVDGVTYSASKVTGANAGQSLYNGADWGASVQAIYDNIGNNGYGGRILFVGNGYPFQNALTIPRVPYGITAAIEHVGTGGAKIIISTNARRAF